MKESGEYYFKSLCPFQDGILSIVKELRLPFYLTGGTALSRYYFSHRFSDDLDLFLNNDDNFNQYVETFYQTNCPLYFATKQKILQIFKLFVKILSVI